MAVWSENADLEGRPLLRTATGRTAPRRRTPPTGSRPPPTRRRLRFRTSAAAPERRCASPVRPTRRTRSTRLRSSSTRAPLSKAARTQSGWTCLAAACSASISGTPAVRRTIIAGIWVAFFKSASDNRVNRLRRPRRRPVRRHGRRRPLRLLPGRRRLVRGRQPLLRVPHGACGVQRLLHGRARRVLAR